MQCMCVSMSVCAHARVCRPKRRASLWEERYAVRLCLCLCARTRVCEDPSGGLLSGRRGMQHWCVCMPMCARVCWRGFTARARTRFLSSHMSAKPYMLALQAYSRSATGG